MPAQSFSPSRRNLLRGGAIAGGLALGSGMASADVSRASAAATLPAEAVETGVQYWLQLDGIEGESQDSQHENWIDLGGYSFGVTDSETTKAGSKGKVSFKNLSVTKVVDKASPKLFLNCCNGKHIKTGTMSLRKANAKSDYLTITLTDVVISGYRQGAADTDEPEESVSFEYGALKIKYTVQNADGS